MKSQINCPAQKNANLPSRYIDILIVVLIFVLVQIIDIKVSNQADPGQKSFWRTERLSKFTHYQQCQCTPGICHGLKGEYTNDIDLVTNVISTGFRPSRNIIPPSWFRANSCSSQVKLVRVLADLLTSFTNISQQNTDRKIETGGLPLARDHRTLLST